MKRHAWVVATGMLVAACGSSQPSEKPASKAPSQSAASEVRSQSAEGSATSSATPKPVLSFHCEKTPPGVPGLRMCYVTDDDCSRGGGSFERESATCYIRSAIDVEHDRSSSTQKIVVCFPVDPRCC
jgi:hypothetical protein